MATPSAMSFPFVDVPGIANFRDIGGNPTTNGASTTKGLIFRCADPSKVSTEGLEKMSQDLGKVNHHRLYRVVNPSLYSFPQHSVPEQQTQLTYFQLPRHKSNLRPPLPPRNQPQRPRIRRPLRRPRLNPGRRLRKTLHRAQVGAGFRDRRLRTRADRAALQIIHARGNVRVRSGLQGHTRECWACVWRDFEASVEPGY